MSTCSDKVPLLGGLLDGELDAANTATLEAHIAGCAACLAELERLEEVRAVLRQPELRSAAPARLRDAIVASSSNAPARREGRRLPSWLVPGTVGAMAASLALLIALPQAQIAFQPPIRPAISEELVASHVRSLLAAHLTDVQTSDQHVVRPWFNGKIDFAPPVPELAALGFPLVGGRLDYIGGRVVPAIVYRRRLHTVNLFVWPDHAGATGMACADGYCVAQWVQDGLHFAAVSDIDPADLTRFREVFAAAVRH